MASSNGVDKYFPIICFDNKDYPEALKTRKVYLAYEKEGWLHVIDETKEDHVYPRKGFVKVSQPYQQVLEFLRKEIENEMSEV